MHFGLFAQIQVFFRYLFSPGRFALSNHTTATARRTCPAHDVQRHECIRPTRYCTVSLDAVYCALRKQIFSPSSRYSAEQTSPPQIIVSPA